MRTYNLTAGFTVVACLLSISLAGAQTTTVALPKATPPAQPLPKPASPVSAPAPAKTAEKAPTAQKPAGPINLGGAVKVLKLSSLDAGFNTYSIERADARRAVLVRGKEDAPSHVYGYVSQKSETFLEIAALLGLPMETLASFNGLEHPQFFKGGGTLYFTPDDGLCREIAPLDTKSGDLDITISFLDFQERTRYFRCILTPKFTPAQRTAFLTRPFTYPLRFNRKISSGFGAREDPMHRLTSDLHQGVDFPSAVGTPVHAAASGVVEKTGENDSGYGIFIVLKHKNGYTTLYGHLSKVLVKKGDPVSVGDVIGQTGSSGRSTGPHLHFGIAKNGKYVDPVFLLSG